MYLERKSMLSYMLIDFGGRRGGGLLNFGGDGKKRGMGREGNTIERNH